MPKAFTSRNDDRKARTLLVLFGDQLDLEYSPLKELDKDRDAVLMMEVAEEATHVPSHKQRTALFLSAMRHFATELADRGHRVRYVELDDPHNTGSFDGELRRAAEILRPERIVCIHPGEWRVMEMIERWSDELDAEVDLRPDEHFLVDLEDFRAWAEGRKTLILEHFYRRERKRLGVLIDEGGKPRGGTWNYDKQNRDAFKAAPDPPKPYTPRPDAITREVFDLVERAFPDAYGSLEDFRWPVTRAEARRALRDFVDKRLPRFGDVQDAMWAGQPTLYHSLLSTSLNLKLLRPMECVDAALEALDAGKAPLNCVEGFVRQIIGWREFIRGVYWNEGRGYADRNALRQRGDLPDLYWTAETDMNCMRESVGQVLGLAYGHHIQRLMITGNFALIAGVHPRQVSDWYLGMYADAVDWVTLPNTLGMAMHADGGVVGTKPYAASGKYVKRMSNYCDACRYDVNKRTGEDACPFNTLYWDFLVRNRERFDGNQRMAMILKNVDRLSDEQRVEITASAKRLKRELGVTKR